MPELSKANLRILALITLLVSAAWVVLSAPDAASLEASASAPSVGFLAPDFTLDALGGDPATLSDYRGQAVILNLWASWCGPCRAEMPAMQTVFERYKQQGFTILAVNATNQDSLASAQAFVEELGVTYPVLLDRDGAVSAQYNLRALPTTYFIAPDGRIREVVIGGPMAEALLSIRAEQLLAELR